LLPLLTSSPAALWFSRRLQGLGDERVVELKAGWKHTLAVTDSGKFYSWGRNVNGQVWRQCDVV
jgi:alpha-tubulin suppressor-like RCC1 family protein